MGVVSRMQQLLAEERYAEIKGFNAITSATAKALQKIDKDREAAIAALKADTLVKVVADIKKQVPAEYKFVSEKKLRDTDDLADDEQGVVLEYKSAEFEGNSFITRDQVAIEVVLGTAYYGGFYAKGLLLVARDYQSRTSGSGRWHEGEYVAVDVDSGIAKTFARLLSSRKTYNPFR